MRSSTLSALLMSLALLGSTSVLFGQVLPLASPGQLGTPYNQLGIVSASQPIGYVSSGPSISFMGADKLTFSRGAGQFEVDQAGTTYGDTAFSSGTNLVGAGGFQGPGDGGPVELTFALPVLEFGLNIEDFAGGAYTVDYTVIDADGADPTFSASGNDPLDGSPGVLSFEGAAALTLPITGMPDDSIYAVIFTDSAAGGTNDLMFGNIDYSVTADGLQAPPTVTPEPSSLTLFGSGLLGIAAFLRRNARPIVPRRRRA